MNESHSEFFVHDDPPHRPNHDLVEVRFDDEEHTTIDEVMTATVHLERMDYNKVWISMNGYHVWLRARGKITITGYPEDCTPVEDLT